MNDPEEKSNAMNEERRERVKTDNDRAG